MFFRRKLVGRELWFDSCMNGKTDDLLRLLDQGIDVNVLHDTDKKTGLHIAVDNHQVHTAMLLLRHGANINAQDSLGYTPLTYAVNLVYDTPDGFQENVPLVESLAMIGVLLAAGANPDIPDATGKSPLQDAKEINYTAAIQLMKQFSKLPGDA